MSKSFPAFLVDTSFRNGEPAEILSVSFIDRKLAIETLFEDGTTRFVALHNFVNHWGNDGSGCDFFIVISEEEAHQRKEDQQRREIVPGMTS